MGCLIYLLLATVHHFRIGERPGLVRLFGFGQVSRLRDEGRNESPCCQTFVLAPRPMGTEALQDPQFQFPDIHQKVMKSVDDQQLIDPSERWRHPTSEVAKLAQRLQFHLTDAFTRNIQQTADLSQGVAFVAV